MTPEVSIREAPAACQGGLPDITFIKSKIAIADIAGELGLEVVGSMVRCWRPEKHQHGDRTPSVGIDRRRNRMRCFVCDQRAYSGIDLVQMVQAIDTRGAIKWIASRFLVPTIPKGRHLPKVDEFRGLSRVGCGGALEMVIRSGLWSQFTASERAILPVFSELTEHGTSPVTLSYRGIRRFSGIRSDSTVAAVLRRFQTMHLLHVHRGMAENGLRACNSYELTLDDPHLQKAMLEIYESERHEIEAEREYRKEQRQRRQAQVQSRKAIEALVASDHQLAATA
jgi:hypothetical protein